MNVRIYSDGSAKGNPGTGGYGTIVEFVDKSGQYHYKEFSQGYVHTTNNRMEIMGAIVGLEALEALDLDTSLSIEIISDSQYLINSLNENRVEEWRENNWKRQGGELAKNQDLWERLLKAKGSYQVIYTWVEGHKSHPYNKRCDEMAKSAADGANLTVDEGYMAE